MVQADGVEAVGLGLRGNPLSAEQHDARQVRRSGLVEGELVRDKIHGVGGDAGIAGIDPAHGRLVALPAQVEYGQAAGAAKDAAEGAADAASNAAGAATDAAGAATDKAQDAAGGLMSKIGGLFGGDDK